MARSTAAPDAQEVLGLLSDLKAIYLSQDDQIKGTRAVREMADPVMMPDKYVDIEVRDPTVADETKQVSATLNVNPPTWHVARDIDANDDVQKNATLRERWSEGIFDVCGRGMDGTDTRTRLIDSCVGDGGAFSKFLFDKDLWENRYAVKRGDMAASEYLKATDAAAKADGPPFYFGYADPLTIYPAYSGRKIQHVIEVSERPLYSTLRKYRLTIEKGDIVPGDIGQAQARTPEMPSKIDFIEYWDDTYCVYVINGLKNPYAIQIGRGDKPFKHGYGRPPYFPAYGFMMGHWANRKVGWGIAETKRWLVQYMSYLLTVHANVAARDAFTPVIHYLAEGQATPALVGNDEKKQYREEKVGLREVIREPFGGKWDQFPVRDTAPALKEQIAMIGEKIEKALTPRVTSQIGGGLEGAGFAINQVLAEAKIQHHPYVQGLERCFEQMTQFAWDLVRDKVREKVWVYCSGQNTGYIGLGPDDVKDAVHVEVELDPERPAAKLIESRYHQEQVAAGFENQDMAIEAQGRNPDEVLEGQSIDRMRKQPWFTEWEDQVTREKMGYGHLVLLAQQAQQVAQSGTFPNGQPVNPMGGQDMGQLAATPNQAMPDTAGGPAGNGFRGGPGNQGGTNVEVPQASAAPGMAA